MEVAVRLPINDPSVIVTEEYIGSVKMCNKEGVLQRMVDEKERGHTFLKNNKGYSNNVYYESAVEHRNRLASKKAKSNDGRLAASKKGRPKKSKSGSSNSGGLKSWLKPPPELMGKSNVATATSAASVQPLSPSKTAARQMNKRTRDVVDLHDSDSDYNDEIE